MKCANCQMDKQTPETPCSHCGRMLPAPEPCYIDENEAAENGEEGGAGETGGEGGEEGAGGGEDQNGTGETEETGAGEADSASGEPADEGGESGDAEPDPEGELAPEDGHVDNVGDESETETILP